MKLINTFQSLGRKAGLRPTRPTALRDRVLGEGTASEEAQEQPVVEEVRHHECL